MTELDLKSEAVRRMMEERTPKLADALKQSTGIGAVVKGDRLKGNGWTMDDVERGARALVEAERQRARRGSSAYGAYAPMTDEEWHAHKRHGICAQALVDATCVLEAVSRHATPEAKSEESGK